jgi:predicted O-methyltransferase YrrM
MIAALDAKASGVPLAPELAARIHDVLVAFGAAELVDGVSAQEAAQIVAEIRQQLMFDQMLLRAETRATRWSPESRDLLVDIGNFSRSHADLVSQKIVPELGDLAERLARAGAAFLDVGVGVAGTATRMAELWPNLRIVGIDVWQPSLVLARDSVREAGLEDRIELREQAAEQLEDESAFDLAWIPTVFMNEKIIPQAVARVHRALRPGGWMIFTYACVDGIDALPAALWRLRVTTFGGTLWPTSEVERTLKDAGLTEIRALPLHPSVPAGFLVARRQPA